MSARTAASFGTTNGNAEELGATTTMRGVGAHQQTQLLQTGSDLLPPADAPSPVIAIPTAGSPKGGPRPPAWCNG